MDTQWRRITPGKGTTSIHKGGGGYTSSYFLSASSAKNLASLSWFSSASIRSSSDKLLFSKTLRILCECHATKKHHDNPGIFLSFGLMSCYIHEVTWPPFTLYIVWLVTAAAEFFGQIAVRFFPFSKRLLLYPTWHLYLEFFQRKIARVGILCPVYSEIKKA